LCAKVDPNISDKKANTPLHVASSKDHERVVSLLLSFGAKKDITNNTGITAVQEAKGISKTVWEIYNTGGKKALEKAGYPVYHRSKKKQITHKNEILSKANSKIRDGWNSFEKQRKKIRNSDIRGSKTSNDEFIFSEIPNQNITDMVNYDKSLAISIQDSDEYSSVLDASVDSSEFDFGVWDTTQDIAKSNPPDLQQNIPFSDYEEDILLIKITIEEKSTEPVMLYYSKSETVEHFREHLYNHPKLSELGSYPINDIRIFTNTTKLELYQKLSNYKDLNEIILKTTSTIQ